MYPNIVLLTQKVLIEVGTKLMFKIHNANQNIATDNKRYFQDTPKYNNK